MDGLGEVAVNVLRGVFRAMFEALFQVIFGRLALLIGYTYQEVYRDARRLLRFDFLATPVAMLLLLLAGCAIFVIVVRGVQMLLA